MNQEKAGPNDPAFDLFTYYIRDDLFLGFYLPMELSFSHAIKPAFNA